MVIAGRWGPFMIYFQKPIKTKNNGATEDVVCKHNIYGYMLANLMIFGRHLLPINPLSMQGMLVLIGCSCDSCSHALISFCFITSF